MSNSKLKERLEDILIKIKDSCARSNRNSEQITIVAVSKTKPVELMCEYITVADTLGVKAIFGESYVQEFKAKKEALHGNHEVHLIGALQSNKVRDAVKLFDVIQSVHSEKILKAIDIEAQKQGKLQRIFLQVNISSDPNKNGFSSHELPSVFEKVVPECKNISLEGLMTITALYNSDEDTRRDFKAFAALKGRLSKSFFSNELCHLSMGMSTDYEIAIEEGASMVRIGSALFGERDGQELSNTSGNAL